MDCRTPHHERERKKKTSFLTTCEDESSPGSFSGDAYTECTAFFGAVPPVPICLVGAFFFFGLPGDELTFAPLASL